MTEETLAEMIKEKLDEAYKSGYNNACEVLSSAFLANKDKFESHLMADIMTDVANTIMKCKLK